MKYYLYISDEKVEMLLSQISDTVKREIASELKFNLGVLSGSIGETRFSLDKRTNRLEAVVKKISSTDIVVDPDTDNSWINGKLEAKPFCLGDHDEVTFYLCETDKCIILLGGSSKHLIGGDKKERWSPVMSYMDRLLDSLTNACNSVEVNLDDFIDDQNYSNLINKDSKHQWKQSVSYFLDKHQGAPTQKIDFLSKVLFTSNIKDKVFKLVTPLYVSLE